MAARAAAGALHRRAPVRERLFGRALCGPGRARRPAPRASSPTGSAPDEFAPRRAGAGRGRFPVRGRAARASRASTCCCARWRRCASAPPVSAVIVGAGPDARRLQGEAAQLGLDGLVDRSGRHAGARGLRARPRPGRAVARREPALHRARGGRGRPAAAGDRCRRHPRDRRRHRYGAAAARTMPTRSRTPCWQVLDDPVAARSRADAPAARPSPSASPSQR